MMTLVPAYIVALAALVTSISALVWSLRHNP
ncbi:hypothetical protein NOVOSPHI9U_260004 [Novosphingobium sp. 9U]|nr:hypothetical protein NOVOSPHI9U_260004 [Novosphingobium sp. 9U]